MKIKIKKPKSISREMVKIIRAHLRQRQSAQKQINMGTTIRNLRLNKGLSGADLCRRSFNLDPRTLTALEKGRIKNPSIALLRALSSGLTMNISDIFRHAESRPEELFKLGSPQGEFEIIFSRWGIRIVSFMPFLHDFFSGKLIIGAKKRMNETLLSHPHPICVSVLMGRFEVVLESKPMMLKEGANLFFYGSSQFSFFNPLERESTLLFVTAPSFLGR